MKLRAAALSILICLLALGCTMREVKRNYDSARDWVFDTEPTAKPSHIEDDTPIIELNYEAADKLDSDLWLKFSPESPVYFKAFTNLSDPADPAPFGRVVAEQVAARLAQSDLNVVDGEPRADDYTTPAPKHGTVAKTEDSNATMASESEISTKEQLRPILPSLMTGTYLLGDDVIFVSARITTLRDKQLISAYQWTLPINQNTRMLLPQLLSPQRGMHPTVQTRF